MMDSQVEILLRFNLVNQDLKESQDSYGNQYSLEASQTHLITSCLLLVQFLSSLNYHYLIYLESMSFQVKTSKYNYDPLFHSNFELLLLSLLVL